MHRLLSAAGLLLGYLAIATFPITAQDSPSNRTDPAAAIRFFDANGDQKLSQEEFLKLAERNDRLKGNVNMAKQVFKRHDVDGDGVLTVEEFSQLRKPQSEKPPMSPAATEQETIEGGQWVCRGADGGADGVL